MEAMKLGLLVSISLFELWCYSSDRTLFSKKSPCSEDNWIEHSLPRVSLAHFVSLPYPGLLRVLPLQGNFPFDNPVTSWRKVFRLLPGCNAVFRLPYKAQNSAVRNLQSATPSRRISNQEIDYIAQSHDHPFPSCLYPQPPYGTATTYRIISQIAH